MASLTADPGPQRTLSKEVEHSGGEFGRVVADVGVRPIQQWDAFACHGGHDHWSGVCHRGDLLRPVNEGEQVFLRELDHLGAEADRQSLGSFDDASAGLDMPTR